MVTGNKENKAGIGEALFYTVRGHGGKRTPQIFAPEATLKAFRTTEASWWLISVALQAFILAVWDHGGKRIHYYRGPTSFLEGEKGHGVK